MTLPGPPRATRAPERDSQAVQLPSVRMAGQSQQVELALQDAEQLLGLPVQVRADVEAGAEAASNTDQVGDCPSPTLRIMSAPLIAWPAPGGSTSPSVIGPPFLGVWWCFW